ncbi:MAG: DUF1330 domain-containing protein [Polyangiaceae bacterium]
MVFITQLVYLHPGKEGVFEEFEAHALALISKHKGELLLRLRPSQECVLAGSIDRPYEIHLVRFPSEEAFDRFAADEERQRFLHLKEEAVRSTLLIHGGNGRDAATSAFGCHSTTISGGEAPPASS